MRSKDQLQELYEHRRGFQISYLKAGESNRDLILCLC